MDNVLKLERKNIYKQMLHIALPITMQNFMHGVVGASDALMLGYVNQDSLAAASLGSQVTFVHVLFLNAIVTGLTLLASQYWGKSDKDSVEKIFGISMRISMIIGMCFFVLTLFWPREIMYLFTNDAEIVAYGMKYLRIISLTFILCAFSQVYMTFMKVCDNAFKSSLIGSSAVVLNIALNWVFIFGLWKIPAMGIEGAALATLISRIFEVVAILIVNVSEDVKLRLKYAIKVPSKVLRKDYYRYSLPVLVNFLGWGLGVTMYPVIMGHLGSDATAANSIANIVRNIVACGCWGFASAASIIIGQLLGQNEFDKAKQYGGKFVRFSIVLGVISGLGILILIVCGIQNTMLTDNLTPTAKSYLYVMLFYMAYYVIGNSLNSTIIAGIFPAGGDTKFGMICDVITLWVFIVPSAFIAAFVLKMSVLQVAFILTLDEFIKIPVVYVYYKKYRWVRNITTDKV